MKLKNGSENAAYFGYIDRNGRNRRVVALDIGLGKGLCAKYSRLMAERIFGIKYSG